MQIDKLKTLDEIVKYSNVNINNLKNKKLINEIYEILFNYDNGKIERMRKLINILFKEEYITYEYKMNLINDIDKCIKNLCDGEVLNSEYRLREKYKYYKEIFNLIAYNIVNKMIDKELTFKDLTEQEKLLLYINSIGKIRVKDNGRQGVIYKKNNYFNYDMFLKYQDDIFYTNILKHLRDFRQGKTKQEFILNINDLFKILKDKDIIQIKTIEQLESEINNGK